MAPDGNRPKRIWAPLVGWAMMMGVITPAIAQTALPVPPGTGTVTPGDNTTTSPGVVPGAGGSSPTGMTPGTILAPVPTTPDANAQDPSAPPGTNPRGPGTPGAAGSTAAKTPDPSNINSSGFAGTPNSLIAPANLTSESGVLLYGAAAGSSIYPSFGGGGTESSELGIAMGSFTLFPAIEIATGVDSNVYAQNYGNPLTSSPYMTVVPSLELRSNWVTHELRMAMTGGFGFYSNAQNQNYQNYGVTMDAKIEIREDIYITPGIGYRRSTEAIGTPNTTFSQAPTVVDTLPLKFGLYQRFNRLYYEAGVGAVRFFYTDHSTITSGSLPAASRDRWEYEERFRLGYEVTDDVALWIQPTWGQVRYTQVINSADQDRDSNNFGTAVGFTWTVDPTTSFDGNIGLTTRNYTGGSLSSTNATTAGLSGTWNRYAPLTLRPYLTRGITETSQSQYKNSILTAFGLDYRYDIYDAWTAVGGVSYSLTDMLPIDPSTTTSRTDRILRANIGFQYALKPQVGIGPVLEYTQGSSTDPQGIAYDRTTISIRLTAKR